MRGDISAATVKRVLTAMKLFDETPTAAVLAERLGVSRRTVHAVFQQAVRDGLLGPWDNEKQERQALRAPL